MTKTDPTQDRARLALAQRQRRFEWDLARGEHTRAAARMVSGKTHDMLNLVQIVQLASPELEKCCGEGAKEFLDDMTRSAEEAKLSLLALMEVARPLEVAVRGPAVGATITRAIAELRPSVSIDAHIAIDPDTATALSSTQLEHLLIGLALDAISAERVEIFVRDRTIDGKRWVEIVRGADGPTDGDHFDLRAVELIAKRVGGELASSERRGGGTELVVAIPAV